MNYFPNMKLTTKFGLFALICASVFAATTARAVNGLNIGNTVGTINITDKQSTNLFDPASVTDTDTNILTVFITFTPTSLGGFQSLPAGVVHSNNTYVIDVTNVATATSLIGQLNFV